MREEILLVAQACVSASGDCMVCRYDQMVCEGDKVQLIRLLAESKPKENCEIFKCGKRPSGRRECASLDGEATV